MSSIEQEVGKHLTQGTGIDRKVFTRTVASLDLDTLEVESQRVKIDYRAQQPRYVGVLWTYGTSEPIHRSVGDLSFSGFLCFKSDSRQTGSSLAALASTNPGAYGEST